VHVARFVDALFDAIDPSETQRLVDRFRIAEPPFARGLVVEPDPQLALHSVMLLEPRAERLARSKEARRRVRTHAEGAQLAPPLGRPTSVPATARFSSAICPP